ncbi:unnamed protein product [Didymodactylos carnosus]|uniref:ABC transporter domain-containing protein n=1 Tax=Didymodactylos carnosus TaxID=1234261 RepID=A0A814RGL5_9BILA|nr:unnamed protein product [Didymodactylos carnosus]CAF1132081.1 unnamed protein product [Didymodactylos carnosus]CAF3795962.1 unnamed protein product [Didymodactylos carnosus]CAF3895874.1 unnamed protein product [Didymodactylos carnosus]
MNSTGDDNSYAKLPVNDNNSKTTSDNDSTIVTFHNINYSIRKQKFCNLKKTNKQILSDITGIFKPGMNAILGPTGSGKSSLLDILADRKDPHGLSGQVLIDGQPRSSDFKYHVGYVVQDDIVSGTLTVRENLTFSASCRLPSKMNTTAEKERIVSQVIYQLGLEKCADSKVGTEFVRGISGGERKRTNIGMELVLEPSIIFFDEPTTGLDSSTARNVMEYLYELSRKGRTIIFSIHQPRYSIYKLFDVVVLLSAGHLVYHGRANQLLPYFSSIGYECERYDNPADFILDVAQGDKRTMKYLPSINMNDDEVRIPAENTDIDLELQQETAAKYLHDQYLKSSLYQTTHQEVNLYLEKFQHDNQQDKSLTTSRPNKMAKKSRLNEFYYVAQRLLRTLVRNPALVIMQAIVTTIFAILVGLIYLNIDRTINTGVKNRIGAIFFIIMNQIFGNLSAIELFLKERALFMHENASGYYHVSTYFAAKLLCDLILMRAIPIVLFSVIVYFMIDFQRIVVKYFIFLLSIWMTSFCSCALCFCISASVNVFGIANLLVAISYVMMMVFGGFLVELNSVLSVLAWIKWVSIFRYASNSLHVNEFKGLKLCSINETSVCTFPGENILKERDIDYEQNWDLWKNFVALGAMAVILFILTYVQLVRIKKFK